MKWYILEGCPGKYEIFKGSTYCCLRANIADRCTDVTLMVRPDQNYPTHSEIAYFYRYLMSMVKIGKFLNKIFTMGGIQNILVSCLYLKQCILFYLSFNLFIGMKQFCNLVAHITSADSLEHHKTRQQNSSKQ